MKVCKICKWWDEESCSSSPDDFEKNKRMCLNPKIFVTGGPDHHPNGYSEYKIDPDRIEQKKREKESLAAACDCSGLANFITNPDFGCILFETKRRVKK